LYDSINGYSGGFLFVSEVIKGHDPETDEEKDLKGQVIFK